MYKKAALLFTAGTIIFGLFLLIFTKLFNGRMPIAVEFIPLVPVFFISLFSAAERN